MRPTCWMGRGMERPSQETDESSICYRWFCLVGPGASGFRPGDDMVDTRRIDPISLSAKPFCQGEPGAIGLSRMPMANDLARRFEGGGGFSPHWLRQWVGRTPALNAPAGIAAARIHDLVVGCLPVPAKESPAPLAEEGAEIMKEYKGSPALDAGLLAAAQAVEHYEISRYGTLIAWAEELGLEDAVSLLEETLEEEKAN